MHTFSHGMLPAALALTGLGLLTAAPAHAQNLVQDGGFEQATSDYYNLSTPFDTHWIVTQGDVYIDNDPSFVFDGSNSLFLTPDSSGTSQIAQGLATTPGESYVLSFYANNNAGNNLLNVGFGSTVVSGGPIALTMNSYGSPSDYTFYQYDVTATTAFTGLTFSAVNDNTNVTELDDINVTPAAVPEASTTVSLGLLLTLGLGGLLVAARRKTQAPAP